MFKTSFAAATAASLLLSGCASLQPDMREVENSRTYTDSREVVLNRILASSTRNAMIIRQVDRTDGVVTVDREIVTPRGNTINDWAECGNDSVFNRPVSQKIELNYLVQKTPAGTTVTVNGTYRELRLNVPLQKTQWVNCASTGVLEHNLLDSFYYEDR
jgi:hypothetical protein